MGTGIKSITYLGKQDVYNMEVEKYHNFSINGGLIVHNSMDEIRYYIMSRPERYIPTIPLKGYYTPSELEDMGLAPEKIIHTVRRG